MITQKEVKELFTYKNGELFWIFFSRGIRKNRLAGSQRKDGRYQIVIKGKIYLRSRLVFLYHKGYFPQQIDHINRKQWDDRIENLREATNSLNQRNKPSRSNTGEKYINHWMSTSRKNCTTYRYTYYRFIPPLKIRKTGKVGKNFKTLDEAIAYKKKWFLDNKEFVRKNNLYER